MPGEEIRQSQKQDNSGTLVQLYYCDECITKDPIRGLRYHCKECEDYDLCESCYLGGVHTDHAFEEVVPQKRKDNETLVAENKKFNLLKKSAKQ
jgi:tRNA G26 N,N-dimethylase Trm1